MPSDLLILIESHVFLWWILVSMFHCAGALCFVSVLQIGRRTLAAGGARHTSTRQQRVAPVGAAGQAAPQASSTCSGRALRGGQSGSARLPSEAPGPLAALGGSDPARPSGTWRMRPRCGGACFSAGSKSASNGQQQHLAEEILTKKSFGFLFVCVAFERFVSYAGRQPAASVCVL